MKYFPVQETHLSDLCNKETQLLHSTDTWRPSGVVLPVEPGWRISEGLSTGCSVPTLPSPCWPCAGEEQWCMGCGNMQPSKSIHVNSALPSTPWKSCFQTSGKDHSEWKLMFSGILSHSVLAEESSQMTRQLETVKANWNRRDKSKEGIHWNC